MSGMKVYATDEKELIMELSMKWAGNPNITVAVKAFGLKATVQVLALMIVNENKLTSLLYDVMSGRGKLLLHAR